MVTIFFIILALIAVSFIADSVTNIYNAYDTRKVRKQCIQTDFSKQYQKIIERMKSTKGTYLVTKVWYEDGHKLTEMLEADSPLDAFNKSSDDKRNLEYYIETVVKQ